jgi:hypothetical protein
MAYDNDPEEFVGATSAIRAEPKRQPGAVVAPLVEELSAPVASVADSPQAAAEPETATAAEVTLAGLPEKRTSGHTPNVFDNYGAVRTDLTEAELAQCTQEELGVLFPLFEAHINAKAAEDACAEGEANWRKATTALDRARKAYDDAQPRLTFHDVWKRDVARLPVAPPDPAVIKMVAAALKVVEAAEQYLAECETALAPARNSRHQAIAVYSQRVKEWAKLDNRPKNVGDLIKERSRVETAQKLKNIAEGLPADYVADSVSTVGPSALDRIRSGAGKGGSVNVGHNMNRMRGANVNDIARAQVLAARVPSER